MKLFGKGSDADYEIRYEIEALVSKEAVDVSLEANTFPKTYSKVTGTESSMLLESSDFVGIE